MPNSSHPVSLPMLVCDCVEVVRIAGSSSLALLLVSRWYGFAVCSGSAKYRLLCQKIELLSASIEKAHSGGFSERAVMLRQLRDHLDAARTAYEVSQNTSRPEVND
eukprot:GHVT01100795.1.p2 GENE.GHVT01100795.1~~GHVT01100795.1.p2  ORF type:complete len:106 (+),score=7.74 GHVT01100795.1:1323-1640(+)